MSKLTDLWKLKKMSTPYLKTLQILLKQNTTMFKNRYLKTQIDKYLDDLYYINIIIEKRVTHKIDEWMR